jgi:uncharacterized protein (DUF1684 family)
MDSTEHEETVLAWRQARERRLRSSDGWLTLVDRLVLDEGDTPLPFGTVTLRDGVATVRADPAAVGSAGGVTIDGQPLVERLLRPVEGAPSAVIAHAGRTYELYRRGDTIAIRVKDARAPALLAFDRQGLTYYPIDPAWRITGRFEPFDPPRQTVHQLDIGPSGPRQVPGRVHFTVPGHPLPLTLEPVLEEDSGRLFFVFGDPTNRTDTSPAGRFLYADLPRDASCILDFNQAFNPPCAFTAFASCPIPPANNRLPVPITAGEKDYAAD